MANTYTQINIHVIFSVKGRENVILNSFKDRLFEYISGILSKNGQFSLAVNGYKDHVHLFFELSPNLSLSDIVRIVKSSSSKWINNQKFVNGKFAWQEGYAAFSYTKSQRNNVIKYIMNQEKHHQTTTFKQEYLQILKNFEINFDKKYIFEFYQ